MINSKIRGRLERLKARMIQSADKKYIHWEIAPEGEELYGRICTHITDITPSDLPEGYLLPAFAKSICDEIATLSRDNDVYLLSLSNVEHINESLARAGILI